MEAVVFWIFATLAVGGAVAVVWSRNPVHSALGLMGTLFSVAVLYVVNQGHFLAAVQVLVYAGAVMTLFLFVIMLIGVDKSEDRSDSLRGQRTMALVASGAFAVLLLVVGSSAWVTGSISGPEPVGTAEAIADSLFNEWVLPFELTAILLIIAAAGTIALGLYKPEMIVSSPLGGGGVEHEGIDDGGGFVSSPLGGGAVEAAGLDDGGGFRSDADAGVAPLPASPDSPQEGEKHNPLPASPEPESTSTSPEGSS